MTRLAQQYTEVALNNGSSSGHHSYGGNRLNENDEVFVWGSNSSHQLAEGSADKILVPKVASSFGSAQQVRSKE